MVKEQPTGPPASPDDATLLTAIAEVWQQLDPPPVDLVDGVLAAIAAEDLEFELLTLVETNGAMAGVRHSAPEEGPDTGAWMLEYEGPDVRIYLRLTRIEDRTRLDGWVVPVKSLTVQLRADGADSPDEVLESEIDEFGRFEFPATPAGLSRLTFVDAAQGAKPRVTPPFWI
jgi:hypothetical protein